MRAALVKDGIVHNVIVAGPDYMPPPSYTLVLHAEANIGDHYDGEVFSLPPPKKLVSSEQDFFNLAIYAENCCREALDHACITIDGEAGQIVLGSDSDDRADLSVYAQCAAMDANFSASIVQTQPHETVKLTATQILAAHAQIGKLVAQSHATLDAIMGAIKTGRIVTVAQISAPETVPGSPELPAWPKALRPYDSDEAPQSWKDFVSRQKHAS